MKEERMKILKMVEDGKISVDEAAKLLSAVNETSWCEENDNDFNERARQFSKDAENFMRGVGSKMTDFAKDMEPRVRNVTKTVVAKTAAIVDDLGKALADCLNSLHQECDKPADSCDCCCGEKEEDSREN